MISAQYIYQRDRYACFSGSCRHNKQTTAMVRVQPFTDVGNCDFLIRAVCNFIVNRQVCNCAASFALEHQFQIVNGMNCDYIPIRIYPVNDFCAVSVRIISQAYSHKPSPYIRHRDQPDVCPFPDQQKSFSLRRLPAAFRRGHKGHNHNNRVPLDSAYPEPQF